MRRPPRVLLVAQHANPEWGSEPLIGWRWATNLEPFADVKLLTHTRNRAAIERAGGLKRPVEWIDTEAIASRISRWNDRLWGAAPVNRLLLEVVAQLAFDRVACRVAKHLVEAGEVDLIHRVSPISPRFPTRLGRLGVPLVIGPVNGGMRTPPSFHEVRSRERQAMLALRPLARIFDPLSRTFSDAAATLIATETTRGVLPKRHREQAVLMSENAVDAEAFRPNYARIGGSLRILYLGRLLPYKGVDFILRSMATIKEDVSMHLDVVGDGPDRGRLEALARELDLLDLVTFHGSVPVSEVPARMESCDVYAFPSVRESGGSTVLEAMAAGKPVLVADHGGPSETVNEAVGVRLPVTSPRSLIEGLASALRRLEGDEALRSSMGRAARRHVMERYTWPAKCRRAADLYGRLMGEAFRSETRPASRPEFGLEPGPRSSLGSAQARK